MIGKRLGLILGATDESASGWRVGFEDGVLVGEKFTLDVDGTVFVGIFEGLQAGQSLGLLVGRQVGSARGCLVGICDDFPLGWLDGKHFVAD